MYSEHFLTTVKCDKELHQHVGCAMVLVQVYTWTGFPGCSFNWIHGSIVLVKR